MMSKYKKWCAIAVVLVYVVNGLLKLMEHIGTGLIVDAYFRFIHMSESVLMSKILGAVLGTLESDVGFATVFCVWQRTKLR